MRIAIVDDDRLWLQKIELEIRDILKDEQLHIDTFLEGDEFINKNYMYDITLMDVEMQTINGFETTRQYKIRYPGAVVAMVTTDREQYNKAFEVEAFRYINKSKMREELQEMLYSLKRKGRIGKKIDVDCIDRHKVYINMNDIMYVERLKRNLMIHTCDKIYTVSETMKSMCERLDGEGFCQCHQSYLINLDEVEMISGIEVVMKNGERVMVSKRQKQEFEKMYFDRLMLSSNK